MALKYIVAVVRESKIKTIVSSLYENNIPGLSVSGVRGFGEHVNVYAKDILEDSVRLEVFVEDRYSAKVVSLIMGEAHTGMEGDGVVAVLPMDDLYQIRNFSSKNGDNNEGT